MPAMMGPIELIRGRIAVKLTLTLVGFVAFSMLAAGVYLNHALEAFAVDALEARLVTAARLLHDDARVLLLRPGPAAVEGLGARAAAPTAAPLTPIWLHGTLPRAPPLPALHPPPPQNPTPPPPAP